MRAFACVDTPGDDRGVPPPAPTAPPHVTLAFLGEVDPARTPALVDAVATAVRPLPPFDLVLDRFGAFPGPAHPKVVYLAASAGAAELHELATRVRDALAAAEFRFDPRPFVPHRTVLRVRGRHDAERARALLDGPANVGGPGVRVHEVLLKTSELTRAGAIHTVIGRCPLLGP